MVEAIVKKIMLKGIKKYAKVYEVPEKEVQIKVTNDEDGYVFYTICVNFQEKERVTFLQIMDAKMDLLGYQQIANPFMKKSIEIYATNTDDEIDNVCSFIMIVKENIIGLAFYNKYKCGKTISLGKHLEELGI
jgi:hypothetical protein